jgi:hypothetical protein
MAARYRLSRKSGSNDWKAEGQAGLCGLGIFSAKKKPLYCYVPSAVSAWGNTIDTICIIIAPEYNI